MIIMTKFIGYIRVSTAKQAEDSLSLQSQAARIRDWAIGQGVELLAIYQDTGSAHEANNLLRRVGLQDAIAHANREDAHLVVVHLDRLSRNTADVAPLLSLLSGGVYSLQEGKLLSSPRPGGPIMAAIKAAQEEADTIAETTADALARLKERGRTLGSPKDKSAAVRASARVRRDNADIAVERIADVISETLAHGAHSARELAELLNRRSILTGAGRKWTVAALRRPLREAKALLKTRNELSALPTGYLFDDASISVGEMNGESPAGIFGAPMTQALAMKDPSASGGNDHPTQKRSKLFGSF